MNCSNDADMIADAFLNNVSCFSVRLRILSPDDLLVIIFCIFMNSCRLASSEPNVYIFNVTCIFSYKTTCYYSSMLQKISICSLVF
jgi:hypothetical protein